MVDYAIHFVALHKIYILAGALLLFLVLLPTKEKMSAKTQKALYLGLVIWIICFGYKLNTDQDIVHLFKGNEVSGEEGRPTEIAGSPFNKYYTNEAGRKSRNGN